MCSLLKQDVLSYAKTHLLEKHRATTGNMEAVTFQQICVQTQKFAPVLKITRVENPESEICLDKDLLCQDVVSVSLLYLPLPAPAIPSSEMCSDALHFIQSRRFTKKWSNFRTKACVLHPLGLCEYAVVSRIMPFCQHLSYKLPKTFFLLPCGLKSRCSICF